MIKEQCTMTGFKIATFLQCASRQVSTDQNHEYPLPDGGSFISIEDVEKWIIETSEKIKLERRNYK